METAMKNLLEYLAKSLVDQPEAVEVREVESTSTSVLELRVGQGDMGKIVGKHGQNIQALRVILTAAAAKQGKRMVLELLE